MKRSITLWMALALMALAPSLLQAQAASATAGKVRGQVTNPTGETQKGGEMLFVGPRALAMPNAKNGEAAILAVDDNGAFQGEVPAGVYTVYYRAPGMTDKQMADKLEKVTVTAGQETSIHDDMSRKEFVDALPEEQRRQLEEFRRKNKAANSANEVIKRLNADLQQASQDIQAAEGAHAAAVAALGAGAAPADLAAKEAEIKSAKYANVVKLMSQDTTLRPDLSALWAQLGQGQMGLKKYDEAEIAFRKALEIENASKKPNAQILALGHGGLGEIYARSGKSQEALAAFDEAAKANPSQAAFYYQNEAVIFMQIGNAEAQAAAADKGIQAKPDQPLFYYLKGQALVSKATVDAAGKVTLPADCIAAYDRYLDLAPNGPYAPEINAIFVEAKQTHSSSYSSKGSEKKKK